MVILLKIGKALSFVLIISILLSVSPFVSASGLIGGTASSIGDFWTAFGDSVFMSNLNRQTLASLVDSVCSTSDDSRHHGPIVSVGAGPAQGDNTGPYYVTCHCNYCGKDFETQTYKKILDDAYKEAVEALPSPVKAIDSNGGLYWNPTVFDMRIRLPESSFLDDYKAPDTLLGMTALNHFIRIGSSEDYAIPSVGDSSRIIGLSYSVPDEYAGKVICNPLCFMVPADGIYEQLDSIRCNFLVSHKSSSVRTVKDTYVGKNFGAQSAGAIIRAFGTGTNLWQSTSSISIVGSFHLPTFKITPTIPLDTGVGGAFGPDTRPGSISGEYGVPGDNGSVTSTGDTYLFDESTNTYHNPVTGDTSNVTEWNYDYSDRSYTVTTDSGNTVTITYGDENVTITENTTNEAGDTVTNNYTYYYITNNTTTPDNPDVPHTHSYSSEITQASTCVMPGVKTFSCSCGDSYTQSVPASGHSWEVKQTVQTVYDETGNVASQGFVIYKCSVCGEEYKSDTMTGPPAGGSGPSSGNEGESLWSKLGELLGGGLKGILDLLSAIGGKILDGLLSLFEMILERLRDFVEIIFAIFDELPRMFSGFLAFLSAVFPFFPSEITLLLTFGILAVVVIGIIKALRR